MISIYLLSLGCPRNMTDSEVLLGLLEEKGFGLTSDAEGADVAIVNTCGFIQDAKQESIDIILRLAELKKAGSIKKLIVAGCLSQRYPKDLANDIPEVDGLFGTSDFTKIPDMIDTMFTGEKVREVSSSPDFLYDASYKRKNLTPDHFVYLKIQEGCSNRCTYCVIPDLKGPRRSRSFDSVVKEAKEILSRGKVKELVIIGQDVTSYGLDTSGKTELADLLREISALAGDAWVRLLYTHPAHFSSELIDVVAEKDNICRYIDLPIQHINDNILKRMNRRVDAARIRSLINELRSRIPGVTLRTSVIVGFPGETDEQFRELIDFLAEIKFERLGAFIYSQEEGTPAADFPDQVPEEVKRARFDEVMQLQQSISADKNAEHIGEVVKVLIDEESRGRLVARSEMDAPEVDGNVFINSKGLKVGDFVDVRITGSMEYDLIGEVA